MALKSRFVALISGLGVALTSLAMPIANASDSNMQGMESSEFQEYLKREREYQRTVVTEPKVVSIEDDRGFRGGVRPIVSPNTSNPVRKDDNKLGLFYIDKGQSIGTCTANYIGGKFWVTAHHCVDGHEGALGFIRQHDGEFAGVENIYVKDSSEDVALLKVGSGINANPFSFSSTKAKSGDRLTVNGFATSLGQYYSSESNLLVTAQDRVVNYAKKSYNNLFVATPAAPNKYATAKGDSGAAVAVGSVMYGVNSGISADQEHVFVANIDRQIPWVRDVMAKRSGSSIAEIWRAFQGGTWSRTVNGSPAGSLPIGSF